MSDKIYHKMPGTISGEDVKSAPAPREDAPSEEAKRCAVLAPEAAEAEAKALRVCGNCEHGKSTSLDDTRCYQNTPYLPTGRHCAGCPDWKRAAIVANPRAALQGGK
jgi:hypothetical protein